MSFFYFNDRETMREQKTKMILLIIGILLLIIGIVFVRADITTTALFYDALGMQHVIDYPTIKKLMPEDNTSPEAWMFGVSLSLLQVYFGYRIAVAKGNEKTAWITAYALTAVFDTYTDTDYRSFGMSMNNYLAIKSLFVSFFVYNLFSEWALGTGFREIVVNFRELRKAFAKSGKPQVQQRQQSESRPSPQTYKPQPPTKLSPSFTSTPTHTQSRLQRLTNPKNYTQ